MALTVSLNTAVPSGVTGFEFYDSTTGIRLTQASPTSADLSAFSAQQLQHIITAVNDGRLLVTAGVLPEISPTRVSLGGPAGYQKIRSFVGTVTLSASAQTVALGTITTGKTWIVTDIALSTSSTAAILAQLQSNTTTIFNGYVVSAGNLVATTINAQPIVLGGVVVNLSLPSGSGVVAYNFLGEEQ